MTPEFQNPSILPEAEQAAPEAVVVSDPLPQPRVGESRIVQTFEQRETEPNGIKWELIGDTLQSIAFQIPEGEKIYSEQSYRSNASENIKMKAKIGEFGRVVRRIIGGESLFVDEFKAENGPGRVILSPEALGEIIPISIRKDKPDVIFQRKAFTSAGDKVKIGLHTHFRKPLMGFFGGEGFILEKATGEGPLHLMSDGEAYMIELKEGEKDRLDQGYLIAFDSTLDYKITRVKGGLRNWLFSGEGFLDVELKGPGRYWASTRRRNFMEKVKREARAAGRQAAIMSGN